MANIYRRGETYWGQLKRDGKRFRKSLETTSKTVAQERLAAWLVELKGQKWGDKPRHAFADAAERFVSEHCNNVAPSSKRRYVVSLLALADSFDGMMLDEITKSKLLEFEQKRRGEGLSLSTVRRDLRCLSVMFSCCGDWEWWDDENPVSKFLRERRRRGGLKEADGHTRYLSHDEESRLLAAAATHRDHFEKSGRAYPMLWAAIVVAIDTGLRDHEQLGLLWPQVDFDRRQVTVKGKGGKTRTVPLLPRTMDVLRNMPRHPKTEYVFWHEDANKRTGVVKVGRYNRLYRPLQTACKKAAITEHVQWHDLRRTCGCRLLQDRRLSMAEVSLWLGHASVKTTEQHYAFLNVAQLHAAVGTPTALLQRALENEGPQKEPQQADLEGHSAEIIQLHQRVNKR
jgi:integrase/recombinase XerD